MKRTSQAPCEGGQQELPLLRLERKLFCHLYLLTETLQFVVTLRDFSTRVRIIRCATVFGWWLRSRRHVRICLDGQISQGTHGPTCSAAITAVNGGFSRSLYRVFNFYCETATTNANNLKLKIIHQKAPEI
jgi:hypothetical protein